MKKFLLIVGAVFICTITFAHTINWYANGQIVSTTTCNSGDNVTPPNAPAKYGYHFTEWLPGVPSGYTRLEYIESTGTQYIDTRHQFTSNKGRIVSKFVSNSTIQDQRLCGAFNGSRSMAVYLWNNTNTMLFGAGSSDTNIDDTYVYNQEYIIDIIADNGTISGTVNTATISGTYSGTIALSKNFWVFNENQKANIPFYGKIYYFRIYENNTLVRDLIPVKRNSDNAIGMYDTVSGTFFTNAGTGEFIAGPEI